MKFPRLFTEYSHDDVICDLNVFLSIYLYIMCFLNKIDLI